MPNRSPLRLARIMVPVLALCALAAGGCGNEPARMAAASRVAPLASGTVAVPPKQLVERVKQIVSATPLSLGVAEAQDGIVVTGWKRYRGDFHIARYWQDRTRYRIEVIPDWNEPAAKSRLAVTAETEQRPAEGQRWDREARVPRPERAEEVLRQIMEQLSQSGA